MLVEASEAFGAVPGLLEEPTGPHVEGVSAVFCLTLPRGSPRHGPHLLQFFEGGGRRSWNAHRRVCFVDLVCALADGLSDLHVDRVVFRHELVVLVHGMLMAPPVGLLRLQRWCGTNPSHAGGPGNRDARIRHLFIVSGLGLFPEFLCILLQVLKLFFYCAHRAGVILDGRSGYHQCSPDGKGGEGGFQHQAVHLLLFRRLVEVR